MKYFFLKAKHWQLVLLGFGVLLISLGTMILTAILNSGESAALARRISQYAFMAYFPSLILAMAIILGWVWSIAKGLKKLIPEQLKLNYSRFNMMAIIPSLYSISIFGYMFGLSNGIKPINPEFAPFLALIMIPIHLFSMFAIFYCIYFAAKTLKVAQLQRKVGSEDLNGEFFAIWFFPVGIWILQPTVNKLFLKMTQPPPLPKD